MTPLRWAGLVLAAAVAGVVLGAGSGWLALSGATFGGREWQGWSGDPTIGSHAADPWTRARTAKTGLLALTKAETIYFTRYRDERGRALDERCSYLLEGGALPARWWSATLYAADNFLPRSEGEPLSIDATRAHRDGQGRWRARVGPQSADAADWISTKAAGRFSLTLRLYNPAPSAAADFGSVPFPTLKTLGCEGGIT